MNEPINRNDARAPTVTAGPSFSVAAVLNKSFSSLFGNFGPFMILAILIMSPTTILNWLVMDDVQSGSALLVNYIAALVIFLLDWLLYYVLSGTVVYGTFMYLRGNRASLGASINQGLSALFPVIIVVIISTFLMLLGMFALIIPGIIILLMLYVAVPATVVERPGIIQGLKRSAELTKGNRWKILGLLILTGMLITVIQTVIFFVLSFTANSVTSHGSEFIAFFILQFVFGAVGAALFAVVNAVTYHDLRMVKEGLEL